MIISLGWLLPDSSCSLPGIVKERAAPRTEVLHPCLALLQTGVAWPAHYCDRRWSLTPPFHPYQPEAGGMFLWPDPANCFTPGITRRLALRSADFPRSGLPDRDHPTDLGTRNIPRSWLSVNPPARGAKGHTRARSSMYNKPVRSYRNCSIPIWQSGGGLPAG